MDLNPNCGHRNVNNSDILSDFQARFFATARLVSFPWSYLENDLESKSSDMILDILKQTCHHSLCKMFPPSVQYRKMFLSELIKRMEAAGCDPLDQIYDALAEVVGTQEAAEGYKSYLLPDGSAVSLLENLAVISEGTTGLVTWEAALYLAEWALDHQQAFAGRSVLELGSGVGLTGITICRYCAPSRFIFSDCHAGVLQRLRENVKLNGLLQKTTPAVQVEALDWETATQEQLTDAAVDTIIAADVVYDPEVAGILAKLLSKILEHSPPRVAPDIWICSTIRNPDTYSGFKRQLENAGMEHEVITGPVCHVFPYNRLSDIEILKVYRKLSHKGHHGH